MISDQDMARKLEGVDKSYPAFVDMTMGFARHFGIEGPLMRYMDETPGVTASDAIRERCRLAYGIAP